MSILDGITPQMLNKEFNAIYERAEFTVTNRAEFSAFVKEMTDRELAVYIADHALKNNMDFVQACENGNSWLEHRSDAELSYGKMSSI